MQSAEITQDAIALTVSAPAKSYLSYCGDIVGTRVNAILLSNRVGVVLNRSGELSNLKRIDQREQRRSDDAGIMYDNALQSGWTAAPQCARDRPRRHVTTP